MKRLERLSATARVRGDSRRPGTMRGHVPGPVLTHLGAREGDTLVFDEGCERSVTAAALRGPYFVVRLARAPAAPESAERAQELSHELAPFDEVVRRKAEGE